VACQFLERKNLPLALPSFPSERTTVWYVTVHDKFGNCHYCGDTSSTHPRCLSKRRERTGLANGRYEPSGERCYSKKKEWRVRMNLFRSFILLKFCGFHKFKPLHFGGRGTSVRGPTQRFPKNILKFQIKTLSKNDVLSELSGSQ